MLKKVTAILITVLMCTACSAVLPEDISALPDQTQITAESANILETAEPADTQASIQAAVSGEVDAEVALAVNGGQASVGFEEEAVPAALSAILLDFDRAVLVAQPLQMDQKVRETGFYYGTNAGKLSKKVKSNRLIHGYANKLLTKLKPGTQYYFQPYVVTREGTVRGELASFVTPATRTWTAQDAIFENTADRYIYLFGNDAKFYTMQNPPFGYATKAEAQSHMIRVSVPVWKLSKGKKVASKMSVTVNKKLANNVNAIFAEIYALDVKFPITALAGYSYRKIVGPGLTGSQIMSHHSFGAAIDINKAYNKFYLDGDLRDPGSPYYIPREVIDIFARYGWAWGGDFKEGFDTMHFQYLGLDLTE